MSYGSRRLRDYTRSSGFVQLIPAFPSNTLQWTVINGVLTTNTLPTATQVLGMTQSIATQLAGTFGFNGALNQYLFICIPKYFGLVTTFAGDQSTFTLLTPSPAITAGVGVTGNSTTDVPLEVFINGIAVEYNVYVSNAISATATPSITVS